MPKTLHSIGLMSGTSLDGIDAALIVSDGNTITSTGQWLTVPYAKELREQLRGLLSGQGDALLIEKELTVAHAEAVTSLLQKATLSAGDIDIIGFHGQTIIHRPHEGITWQIGNGSLLAALTGIDVVCDFRRRDMASGGQGAPLVPLYHAAIARNLPRPLAIANIGGVGNVTWIGEDTEHELLAFDTGPGNALLDDWIVAHTGSSYDEGGKMAASGTIDKPCLAALLADAFFTKTPPKSLDRNHFKTEVLRGLSCQDGAATLVAFTAESLARAKDFFPEPVKQWVICGGGRHNHAMMQELSRRLTVPVTSIDALGYAGDAIEAQAFGYLAVRSRYGLPLTIPSTTGVTRPVSGGAFYRV